MFTKHNSHFSELKNVRSGKNPENQNMYTPTSDLKYSKDSNSCVAFLMQNVEILMILMEN